jgi:hypothetical protein
MNFEPLFVPNAETTRLRRFRHSIVYSKISKCKLGIGKVRRMKITKYTIAIYFISMIIGPSPANIIDRINIRLFVSAINYEFGCFIRQNEIAWEFDFGVD